MKLTDYTIIVVALGGLHLRYYEVTALDIDDAIERTKVLDADDYPDIDFGTCDWKDSLVKRPEGV